MLIAVKSTNDARKLAYWDCHVGLARPIIEQIVAVTFQGQTILGATTAWPATDKVAWP